MKVSVLDCDGLFKDCQAFRADIAQIAGMDALSLNYWVSKFVLILWTLILRGTAKVLCRILFGKFKVHCERVVYLYVFFFEGLLA